MNKKTGTFPINSLKMSEWLFEKEGIFHEN